MKKLTLLFVLLAVALVSFSAEKKPRHKARKKTVRTSMAFPVAGKKSNYGDLWGARRDGGRRKHKGVDIYARKGTPVVAIDNGVIVEKANMPVGGKTLWLKPAGKQWTAYYAHLDKQLVKKGQRVRKGQLIGTVGNTGNARHSPSHLHFGVEGNNGWVNPLPYVKHATKVVAQRSSKAKKGSLTKKHRQKTARHRR